MKVGEKYHLFQLTLGKAIHRCISVAGPRNLKKEFR